MRLIRWAGAAEHIFGWKAEEVLGKRMEDFRWIYEGDQTEVQAVSTELTTGSNSRRFSANRNYCKDGSVVHCEWYNSSLVDRSGQLLSILSLVLDVTARKAAEAELLRARDELEVRVQERTAELQHANEKLRREIEARRQTERELMQAELRYRTVAQFTYDWEYWETPDSCLEYCSPSCERITGYTAQEFTADPQLLQKIVHPDDIGLWRKYRAESLATTEPRAVEFRICKKNGAVRWLEHAWQPVLGSEGVFLGIRASSRDITDRREAELNNQQLHQELAHVTRAATVGQLAASLAHELNQPLTAIRCNAQSASHFLGAEPPNLTEMKEVLADIAGDTERASGIIRRLRALFQKQTAEKGVLQLNEIILETLELLRSELVMKRTAATAHLDPALPHILGNRIELQQVVLNLAVNALEAMSETEPGERQIQIFSACKDGDKIEISICDTGPGIRVEPISRLFEPFFTTKATGMGMGLAICQSIVESHEGTLQAHNNPDRGATFLITLPARSDKHQ
jgi:PAS domain S-box-containing protein